MTKSGFLGIDLGTQGLSLVFTDEQLQVVATGEGHYEMQPGLAEGHYTQSPEDWTAALMQAIRDLRLKLRQLGITPEILAIGISGQMHGEVLVDSEGLPLSSARLWCDSRNEAEGIELTSLMQVKIPKRMTAARWLWTTRNRPEVALKATHLTTPGGWLAFQLTGNWNLGIGDASGMFPIDSVSRTFDLNRLEKFDKLVPEPLPRLKSLLPTVRCAGENGGCVTPEAARLFDLPKGIPVAPAEGDQPAALAGSLIAFPGLVSMSFGTSVCANSVGERAFQGVARPIDHFCAPDGRPINMVWLRNGTTFMNTLVQMFGSINGKSKRDTFSELMSLVVQAPDDCGGLLALPFMDDEPGLCVLKGGGALLYGLNATNASPGNICKAAILATMFNLRIGSQELDQQGFPRNEIILSGGLTQTPELGQLLANTFNCSVKILKSGAEGSAWGAALLAAFRFSCSQGAQHTWCEYLKTFSSPDEATCFNADPERVAVLNAIFSRYQALLDQGIHRRD